jgi:O-antigen/teichoic acid export membrane protein
MSETAAQLKANHQRGERFLINVLWSWTGVAASLFQGIVIMRFLIQSLGAEHYGIWLQVFSILNYFWYFDLGLNTAVCNFSARFLAVSDHEKINQLINTSVFYFSLIALAVWSISPFLAVNAHRFFRIRPEDQHEFATLILITGISWGLCIMLHLFLSALDGFQRFDLTSRIMVTQVALRSIGYYVALKTGHGLVMMAEVFVATQIMGYVLNFLNFRRVFPQLRLSPAYIKLPMFQDILRYGLKSFVANGSTLMLNQGGALMVGHYLSESAVGFYLMPTKLLEQAIEAVSRIGMVTRSSAAELSVTARREATISLGIYSNRYSLTLFMPLACFLLVFGRQLIFKWLGAEMADNGGPLLPVFILSYGLVLAAQFNSSSLLFGVNRHGGYARGLVFEAMFYIAALAWAVPRYGIWGAAWVSAISMLAVRGIYTPWLVSRALDYSFISYMSGIYVRPLLVGVPVVALAMLLKQTVLPGRNIPELIVAGAICAVAYLLIAVFACIAPSHRVLFFSRIPVIGARFAAGRA